MSTVATIHLLHWPDVQDIRSLLGSTALFLKLAASDWIAERRNLLLTGARGLGKSWLACALGHKRAEKTSPFSTPAPRLFADLAIAHGDVCCVRYAVGTTTICALPSASSLHG
jgi:hypothetical protein